MLPKEVKPYLEEILRKNRNIKFVVLYGSFALGTQKRWSDVDIGIYFTGKDIPHSSRILDIKGYRLVSFISRNLSKVEVQLQDPYNWIHFVKRIQNSQLIYQKGRSFADFKSFMAERKPEPTDFNRYTEKFLADLLEYLGKTRNASSILKQKNYARTVALSCFWLLTPLNRIMPYDQKSELDFYLQLKNKPKTFNKLFRNIFLERSKDYQSDARQLALATVKHALKLLKNSQEDWVKDAVENNKLYKLL